jgi:hypothetical protein
VLDLPPKIRSWVPVQIEAAGAWKSYEEFLGWLGNSDPSRPNDTEFLARITKLRVALHKAKHAACAERIKDVLATGQKVVVFMAPCAFVIHVRSRFALTACCIAMRATDTPGLMH